jgi:hypothetical protein
MPNLVFMDLTRGFSSLKISDERKVSDRMRIVSDFLDLRHIRNAGGPDRLQALRTHDGPQPQTVQLL